ncbi:MAG: class I SAM-dependent methyltransferase [Bacteroidales bacterium]|nr:class I SAM-dependent methyltransferase [Bacteroidales bacterium]
MLKAIHTIFSVVFFCKIANSSCLEINKELMNIIKQLYKFVSPKHQNLFLDYKVDLKPRYGYGQPPHDLLYQTINNNREIYKNYIEKALSYSSKIQEIKGSDVESNSKAPVWNNGFLPGLDIVGIYTIISEIRPNKYIEIGSGNSTKVAYKAKQDNGLKTQIISIDPQPRAEIDELADQIIRQPFENIDFDFINDLQENDILFIDNSHRILPNSDSMVFYMEVLPKLKKGVIVHIHDIYLPYDYPQFMCDRFYSEQYGLAMYLLANPQKYETIFPNYFISEDEELSKKIAPIWNHPNLIGVERHGGSFWLQIK